MTDSQLGFLIQVLISGAAIGAIYAMVAIGFNIIYNATGIINLAQGEFVMLGGLLAAWGHHTLGLPVWPAAGLAVAVVAVIGLVFNLVAISPLRDPSVLTMIIITIAVSFILQGATLLLLGDRTFSLPPFLGEDAVHAFGASITPQHLLVMATLLVVAGALAVFFVGTMTGRAMRACAFNRVSARLVGINPRWMVLLAFGLSAGIGGLAGGVIIPIAPMTYHAGPMMALKGFAAAILGGLGHYPAAAVAGVLLGVLEELAKGYISSGYKDAIALGCLLLTLFFRPSGLFGRADLRRLSQF